MQLKTSVALRMLMGNLLMELSALRVWLICSLAIFNYNCCHWKFQFSELRLICNLYNILFMIHLCCFIVWVLLITFPIFYDLLREILQINQLNPLEHWDGKSQTHHLGKVFLRVSDCSSFCYKTIRANQSEIFIDFMLHLLRILGQSLCNRTIFILNENFQS